MKRPQPPAEAFLLAKRAYPGDSEFVWRVTCRVGGCANKDGNPYETDWLHDENKPLQAYADHWRAKHSD